jgi:hypothetical protein
VVTEAFFKRFFEKMGAVYEAKINISDLSVIRRGVFVFNDGVSFGRACKQTKKRTTACNGCAKTGNPQCFYSKQQYNA